MEVALWFVFSLVAGIMAEKKGRSGPGFLFLSLILSPLVGIICAAVAQPNQKELDRRRVKSGEMKRCQFCAELIKKKGFDLSFLW